MECGPDMYHHSKRKVGKMKSKAAAKPKKTKPKKKG